MITWKKCFFMFVCIETINLHTARMCAKKMEIPNVLSPSCSALNSGVYEGFEWGLNAENEKANLKLDLLYHIIF